MELNVYQKLSKVQSEINAPKNQFNKFGNYKYRSMEDVYIGLKPLLEKYNCTFVFSDEIVIIQDVIYYKTIATFTDAISKESISNSTIIKAEDNLKGMSNSQMGGATLSYLHKYCASGLLCVSDGIDADAVNTHGQEIKLKEEKKEEKKLDDHSELKGDVVSEDILMQISDFTTLDKIRKFYKVKYVTDKECLATLDKYYKMHPELRGNK